MMNGLKVNASPGFQARTDAMAPRLKGAEVKVVDFISEHREEIIHLSITEVAERSDTSESTVVRLCRRLGYKGFQDLKINLAREYINPGKQIHEVVEPDDSIVTIKKKIFQANVQALYDSLEVCDDEQLERAVQAVSEAKTIEIYGTGASGAVALDAQHKFLKLGIKCSVYTDSHLQAMSASVLGAGDVVIGISHTGTNSDTLHAMKLAKEHGATLICITNFSKSPMTKMSDIKLYTASKETMFRTDATASRIAQLTIIDTLFAAVANLNYDFYYQQIQKTRDSTIHKRP